MVDTSNEERHNTSTSTASSVSGIYRNILQSPAPICMFYFSHPFGISTPQIKKKIIKTPPPTPPQQPIIRLRRPNYQEQNQTTTERNRLTNRRYQRLLLEENRLASFVPWPRDTWRRQCVMPPLVQLLAQKRGKDNLPDLETILNTIREAWNTPYNRSLLNSRAYDEYSSSATSSQTCLNTITSTMGSGSYAGPGLLRRRYSVPEIIMRKHSLTQQKSNDESFSSGSCITQIHTPYITPIQYKKSTKSDISLSSGSDSNLSRGYIGGIGEREISMRKSTLLRRILSKELQQQNLRSGSWSPPLRRSHRLFNIDGGETTINALTPPTGTSITSSTFTKQSSKKSTTTTTSSSTSSSKSSSSTTQLRKAPIISECQVCKKLDVDNNYRNAEDDLINGSPKRLRLTTIAGSTQSSLTTPLTINSTIQDDRSTLTGSTTDRRTTSSSDRQREEEESSDNLSQQQPTERREKSKINLDENFKNEKENEHKNVLIYMTSVESTSADSSQDILRIEYETTNLNHHHQHNQHHQSELSSQFKQINNNNNNNHSDNHNDNDNCNELSNKVKFNDKLNNKDDQFISKLLIDNLNNLISENNHINNYNKLNELSDFTNKKNKVIHTSVMHNNNNIVDNNNVNINNNNNNNNDVYLTSELIDDLIVNSRNSITSSVEVSHMISTGTENSYRGESVLNEDDEEEDDDEIEEEQDIEENDNENINNNNNNNENEDTIYFPRYSADSKGDLSSHTSQASDSEPQELSLVGTGSSYPYDGVTQLVVIPRLSALPRTLSMEVQASAAEDDDNEDVDSDDSISLVDSLDDPVSPKPTNKKSLKETKKQMSMDSNVSSRQTPTKGEAFFVPIADSYDIFEESMVVAESMPYHLREKLLSRQRRLLDSNKRGEHDIRIKHMSTKGMSKAFRQIELNDTVSTRTGNSIIILSEPTLLQHTERTKVVSRAMKPKKNALKKEIGMLESYTIDAKGNMKFKQTPVTHANAPISKISTENSTNKSQTKRQTNLGSIKKPSKTKQTDMIKTKRQSQSEKSGVSGDHHRRKQIIKDVQSMTLYQTQADLTPDIEGGPRRVYQKTEIQDNGKSIEILEIVECTDSLSEVSVNQPTYRSVARLDSPQKSKIPTYKGRTSSVGFQKGVRCNSREGSPVNFSPKNLTRVLTTPGATKVDRAIADLLIDALNNPDEAGVELVQSPNDKYSKKTGIAKRTMQVPGQRRSANNIRYTQRFEVIPEERSSISVDSSNDENVHSRLGNKLLQQQQQEHRNRLNAKLDNNTSTISSGGKTKTTYDGIRFVDAGIQQQQQQSQQEHRYRANGKSDNHNGTTITTTTENLTTTTSINTSATSGVKTKDTIRFTDGGSVPSVSTNDYKRMMNSFDVINNGNNGSNKVIIEGPISQNNNNINNNNNNNNNNNHNKSNNNLNNNYLTKITNKIESDNKINNSPSKLQKNNSHSNNSNNNNNNSNSRGREAVEREDTEPKAWLGFFKRHEGSSFDSANEDEHYTNDQNEMNPHETSKLKRTTRILSPQSTIVTPSTISNISNIENYQLTSSDGSENILSVIDRQTYHDEICLRDESSRCSDTYLTNCINSENCIECNMGRGKHETHSGSGSGNHVMSKDIGDLKNDIKDNLLMKSPTKSPIKMKINQNGNGNGNDCNCLDKTLPNNLNDLNVWQVCASTDCKLIQLKLDAFESRQELAMAAGSPKSSDTETIDPSSFVIYSATTELTEKPTDLTPKRIHPIKVLHSRSSFDENQIICHDLKHDTNHVSKPNTTTTTNGKLEDNDREEDGAVGGGGGGGASTTATAGSAKSTKQSPSKGSPKKNAKRENCSDCCFCNPEKHKNGRNAKSFETCDFCKKNETPRIEIEDSYSEIRTSYEYLSKFDHIHTKPKSKDSDSVSTKCTKTNQKIQRSFHQPDSKKSTTNENIRKNIKTKTQLNRPKDTNTIPRARSLQSFQKIVQDDLAATFPKQQQQQTHKKSQKDKSPKINKNNNSNNNNMNDENDKGFRVSSPYNTEITSHSYGSTCSSDSSLERRQTLKQLAAAQTAASRWHNHTQQKYLNRRRMSRQQEFFEAQSTQQHQTHQQLPPHQQPPPPPHQSHQLNLPVKQSNWAPKRVMSPNPGWSVTVAGTYFPEMAPDVEMRLSFPKHHQFETIETRNKIENRYDDADNYELYSSKTQQTPSELNKTTKLMHQAFPLPQTTAASTTTTTTTNINPKRSLTKSDDKRSQTGSYKFPDLNSGMRMNQFTRQTAKKAIKRVECSVAMTAATRTITNVPHHQRAMSFQSLHHQPDTSRRTSRRDHSLDIGNISSRRMSFDSSEGMNLSVSGNAISQKPKPKVPTMSEKDLTRRHSSCFTRNVPFLT